LSNTKTVGSQPGGSSRNDLHEDAGLTQLVQAMATYSTNNSAFNSTSSSCAPNDPTLHAALAAGWPA
jgi:hypothetical protein